MMGAGPLLPPPDLVIARPNRTGASLLRRVISRSPNSHSLRIWFRKPATKHRPTKQEVTRVGAEKVTHTSQRYSAPGAQQMSAVPSDTNCGLYSSPCVSQMCEMCSSASMDMVLKSLRLVLIIFTCAIERQQQQR